MNSVERTRRAPRVLIVDDDPIIRTIVAYMLQPLKIETQEAEDGASALDLARQTAPDLILLDHEMRGMNGIEVLRHLKAEPSLAGIPVIFVTGSNEAHVITDCFQSGAADYVHKPCRESELHARVNAALENRRLVDELQWLATHDPLTGLANRSLFIQRLQLLLDSQSEHPERHFAVLFTDFDRFKRVNDNLGHAMGDEFLKEIAARLERGLAQACPDPSRRLAARLGGDEFVVLLEALPDPNQARLIADEVLDALCGTYHIGHLEIAGSASIGVLNSAPTYASAEEMLRDADTAMYEAKHAGRGRCTTFDATMQQRVRDRAALEQDLRRALTRSEFSLVYQPIVSLRTGRTETLEALLRWRHPTRGPIPPSEFIPVAEESGLIVQLGRWSLSEASRQLAEWRHRHPHAHDVGISVNLSRRQLESPTLAEDVAQVLAENGLPPGALHLEVTESEAMHDHATAGQRLQELRDRGIKLDIDDFGTGHSSLACLHRFPVDFLKIDRSFIASVTDSSLFASLVDAITQLARTLQIQVVAEGIETPEQLRLLRALGCDYGQGYLLSRPLPPWQVPEFLMEPIAAFPAPLEAPPETASLANSALTPA